MNKLNRGVLLVGAAAALLGVSACGPMHEPAAQAISAPKLAREVSKQLAEKVGKTPDRVACAGELTGEVGATQDCALAAGGKWLPVTVTATAVEGSDISFDAKVGETQIDEPAYAGAAASPPTAPSTSGAAAAAVQLTADELQENVVDQLRRGYSKEQVAQMTLLACAGGIELSPGNAQECVLEANGQWQQVQVRAVTGTDGQVYPQVEVTENVIARPAYAD